MESFEEVKAAFKAQVEYFLRWLVTMNNYSEHIAMMVSPHAALSISIEGCMESGKDCVRGGAKYNSFGGTATGLATVADSLTAIKYMVFDKKLCTARELYDAYMADWVGHEPLRQRILERGAPLRQRRSLRRRADDVDLRSVSRGLRVDVEHAQWYL